MILFLFVRNAVRVRVIDYFSVLRLCELKYVQNRLSAGTFLSTYLNMVSLNSRFENYYVFSNLLGCIFIFGVVRTPASKITCTVILSLMELENFDVMNFAKCQFSLFLKGDLKVEAMYYTYCMYSKCVPSEQT